MSSKRPSRTAYKVALNIVTLGAVPEMSDILPDGIVDATARLLVASGAVGEWGVRWSRSPRMVSVYRAFDWMLPGQFEAFAHRKAFCERQVREGIAGGATQVLVLGAGYDTLGWRLSPEFPRVRFFEIDEPATAALKAKGVEALGMRSNLRLIARDLGTEKLADVLHREEEWDEQARTVIVAEGLLMYLPPEAVRDLFTQSAAITGEGSRIAFSYVPTGNDGRPDGGPHTDMVLWLLKATGEAWHWSIEPERLEPFLEATGWTTITESTQRHGVEFFAAAKRRTHEEES